MDIFGNSTSQTLPDEIKLLENGNIQIANLDITDTLDAKNINAETQTTETISTTDTLIHIATDNTADILDTGFFSQYNDGNTKYTGLIRDATDGKYHLFDNETSLPTEGSTYLNNSGLTCGDINISSATGKLQLQSSGSSGVFTVEDLNNSSAEIKKTRINAGSTSLQFCAVPSSSAFNSNIDINKDVANSQSNLNIYKASDLKIKMSAAGSSYIDGSLSIGKNTAANSTLDINGNIELSGVNLPRILLVDNNSTVGSTITDNAEDDMELRKRATINDAFIQIRPECLDLISNEYIELFRDNSTAGDQKFNIFRNNDVVHSLSTLNECFIGQTGNTIQLGINNNSPNQALDVIGNIAVSGTVDGRDINADGTEQDNHILSTSNPHTVTKNQIGLSNIENIYSEYDAIVPPTNNSDSTNTDGNGFFSIGSTWFDVVLNCMFVCLDASSSNAIWYQITGVGSGEANTVSNSGTLGIGLFARKTGVDLEFNNINVLSNKLSITLDEFNNINLDVQNNNIDHNLLLNYSVDQHRIIDDNGPTLTSLYSSTQIELGLKSLRYDLVNIPFTGHEVLYYGSNSLSNNTNEHDTPIITSDIAGDSIAGTSSGDIFTRSTGTWDINILVGYAVFSYISGSLYKGSWSIVQSNTANTITTKTGELYTNSTLIHLQQWNPINKTLQNSATSSAIYYTDCIFDGDYGYFMNSLSTNIVKTNLITSESSNIAAGTNKYFSGCLGQNKMIYAPDLTTSQFLIYDTENNISYTKTFSTAATGRRIGAIEVQQNDSIYFLGAGYSSNSFVKYNYLTQTNTNITSPQSANNSYYGGSYDGSRYIYMAPNANDQYVRLDITNDTFETIHDGSTTPGTIDGGHVGCIFSQLHNCVFYIGSNNHNIICYVVSTGEMAVEANIPVQYQGIYRGAALVGENLYSAGYFDTPYHLIYNIKNKILRFFPHGQQISSRSVFYNSVVYTGKFLVFTGASSDHIISLPCGHPNSSLSIIGKIDATQKITSLEGLTIDGLEKPLLFKNKFTPNSMSIQTDNGGTDYFISVNNNAGGGCHLSTDFITGNAAFAECRMFRNTNTTGTAGILQYHADGTSSIQNFLSCNGDSYYNAISGNMSIGTSLNPENTTLHIDNNISLNEIVLLGGTSGKINLQCPAAVTNYNITLPPVQGANNEVLLNNGSGVLSWGIAEPNRGFSLIERAYNASAITLAYTTTPLQLTSSTSLFSNNVSNSIPDETKILLSGNWAIYILADMEIAGTPNPLLINVFKNSTSVKTLRSDHGAKDSRSTLSLCTVISANQNDIVDVRYSSTLSASVDLYGWSLKMVYLG